MTTRTHNALFGLVAVTAAALSFPVFAQDPPQEDAAAVEQPAAQDPGAKGGQTWASVDTDGDGAINKTEAATNAGLSQVFDQADANKDGKLTVDEYKAYVDSQQN